MNVEIDYDQNLTLAVEEELLERFRLHAAERKTSVNALIRQYMEEAVVMEERHRNASAKIPNTKIRNLDVTYP